MKKSYQDDSIDGPEEFNQMALYLARINEILKRFDEKYAEADVLSCSLILQTLMVNTEFKLEEELKEEDKNTLKQVKEALDKCCQKMFIDSVKSTWDKNKLSYLNELKDLASVLLKLVNQSGIIYPKKTFKTIEEVIEDDFS